MVRPLHVYRCLLAALLIGCASGESLQAPSGERDASTGAGGSGTETEGGGRSGTGGSGPSGGIGGGGASGGSGGSGQAGAAGSGAGNGRGGAAGGAVDAGDGRAGSSGAVGRDVSSEAASPIDATSDARVPEAGAPDVSDVDGATCGPVFCFDVFECWIFFPQCGYTACELFACKK